MINVSIMEEGDVKMSCTKCGKTTVVKRSWADTPFWDMYIGQALLVQLGHLANDHDVIRT